MLVSPLSTEVCDTCILNVRDEFVFSKSVMNSGNNFGIADPEIIRYRNSLWCLVFARTPRTLVSPKEVDRRYTLPHRVISLSLTRDARHTSEDGLGKLFKCTLGDIWIFLGLHKVYYLLYILKTLDLVVFLNWQHDEGANLLAQAGIYWSMRSTAE